MVKNSTERKYWKSLSEVSEKASVSQDYSNTPSPEQGEFSVPGDSSATVSRRGFIGLLSASMALATTSCRRPDHKIVPTIKAVEYVTPGLPLWYTTVFSHGNAAFGLVVRSREGRPVKLEGNDKHIASGGASSSWIQGSLLALYDPDRMKHPYINKGATAPDGKRSAPGYSSPETVVSAITDAIKSAEAAGKSTRILIGEHASPSLAALIKEIETTLPSVKFVTVPALNAGNAAVANNALFGANAEFVTDYSKASLILSVDADFLGTDKQSVMNIRGFSRNRKPSLKNPTMNKLIVAEAMMSLTGMNADERVKIAPEQMTAFVASVLKNIAAKTGKGGGIAAAADDTALSAELKETAKKVAMELVENTGKAVVSVGAHLPLAAHVLGMAINSALDAIGTGKIIAHQLPFSEDKSQGVASLRAELKAGSVGVVVFSDVNPMYSGDAALKALLKKVENRYAFSLYEDETASACNAFIPTTHFLETWGDAVAFDGTLTVQQPLVAPLNANSLPAGELYVRLAKALKPDFMGEVATYFDFFRKRWEGTNWEEALRAGVVKPTAESAFTVGAINESSGANAVKQSASVERKGEYVALVTPSYAQYDGSMANVAWFQELPDPVTKMTWDNVALVSQKTAAKIIGEAAAKELAGEYEKTELIRLKTAFGSIELPIWIQPGMQDGVIATTLGFGRTQAGQVANAVGANTYDLMGVQSTGYVSVEIEKTGKPYKVATTQKHHDLMGRRIVQETTLAQMKAGEKELFEREEVPGRAKGDEKSLPKTIMPNFQYKGHRWGMVIDMSACVGCGACITACQAENNIAVVGKANAMNGRDMHWIRIDRYYTGDAENPETILQPMLCQHCENAPCENVCPVAATTHSPEGLNEMTYNRCVGTKYCANNCPYKVRRFNWFNFHKNKRSPLEFAHNPDVTVRMRGVMEKCSFCVQRLTEAKHKAKDDGRLFINDGEVMTACQQACPASALIFGNTNDEKSLVAKTRHDERGFLVLEELNTRPQVTYLAKVRNVAEKAEEKKA